MLLPHAGSGMHRLSVFRDTMRAEGYVAAKVAEAVAAAYPPAILKSPKAAERADAPGAEADVLRHPSVCRLLHRLVPAARTGKGSERLLKRIVKQMKTSFGYADTAATRALTIYADGDAGLQLEGICLEQPRCEACLLADQCGFRKTKLTMRDIPEDERPRERLLRQGADALSNAELLAIVLRSGSSRETALQLGERLLATFGSLDSLSQATPAELCSIEGVGPAKAAQILASLSVSKRLWTRRTSAQEGLTNPRKAYEFLRSRLDGYKKETFVAILLDAKNKPIKDVLISQGSLTQSLVHPREAFSPALRESAAAVIFGHNHPSGDPAPSPEDVSITRRLAEAGRLLGIDVLDHIIVGANSYVSMADEGVLKSS